MARISRRNFLKISGAALVATGGLIALGTTPPRIVFPEAEYGVESQMSRKILVTYASKAGSTAEIAGAIAETLGESGAAVDLRPARAVQSLDGYQMVVIGSAIRIGAWLPEALQFVKANQAQLAQLPVAIFSAHMENLGDDETSRQARAAYSAPVRALVKPAAEMFFAGKIELARLSFLERVMSRMMKSVDEDKRNWDLIRAWAAGLAV